MNLDERIHALIFNGITKAATGEHADDAWMRLSERERFARAVVDELRAGNIEFRLGGLALLADAVDAETEANAKTADERIRELAGKAVDARLDLADAIRNACPGPHAYTQHRDHQPAWCNTCGRGENGVIYHKPAARNTHCSNCGDTRGGPIGHEISECTWDSKAASQLDPGTASRTDDEGRTA